MVVRGLNYGRDPVKGLATFAVIVGAWWRQLEIGRTLAQRRIQERIKKENQLVRLNERALRALESARTYLELRLKGDGPLEGSPLCVTSGHIKQRLIGISHGLRR